RAWPSGGLGAALHAALLTGAMTRCFEMSLQYGNDRTQFGRSIGKFQAVQHQLAVMAEHVAAARIATAAAFRAGLAQPALLPAAIAKARASEAAALAANTAHAVHGAIGVTEEYDLQLYTRRLHGWRLAHGSEAYWHQVVGAALMGSGDGAVQFVRGL
ncbi:acyl-CoA dehydrogenase family protein, partial [Bordetella pertussis]